MAEVLMFHHAQGQTEDFHLRRPAAPGGGHIVHTPDLFGGRTFDSIDRGLAYVDEAGFDELIEQGVRAADGLLAELVCPVSICVDGDSPGNCGSSPDRSSASTTFNGWQDKGSEHDRRCSLSRTWSRQ